MGCTSGSEIPRSPEFEDSFRHRSFAGNIFLIKSPRTRDGFASTRDGCATRQESVRVEGAALSAPKNLGHDGACPSRFKSKKEMPDRASLAIRHLVDVQLAAAKTELCVTVVFFEL